MNVEDHIDWARNVALQYRRERNIPIDYEEAVSLGLLGLMKAVKGYEEGRMKFRSFAWKRVRGELRDWVRMGVRRKVLAPMVSLECLFEGQLPSIDGTEKKVADEELVGKVLKSVRFPEAYALKRYYLDGLTLKEVGKEMVVGEARVSQILAEGRERARRLLASTL